MKIDLRDAKILCKSGLATLVSVSNSGNGALLMIYADKDGNELEWFGNGSLEAQMVLGFDAVHFHSAINAEGYEASSLIERIHLAGMDEHGVIKSADMKIEYLDQVWDWQAKVEMGAWGDATADEFDRGSGELWRPKSYAIEEVVEDMKDRIKTDVETRLSNACAPSQPIATTSGTRLNIARAGIQGFYGAYIEEISIDGGLKLHARHQVFGPFASIYDADVESDRLLAAIRAEGFRLEAENGAHEFHPVRFSMQDEAGQMKAEDMKPSYLDQVRDWQIGMLGGDWIDSQNLDCGATGTLWRPKSRSVEIDEGLLNPWAESTISVVDCVGSELTAEASRAAIDSQAQFNAELEASAIDLDAVSRTSTGGILDQTEPDIQGERVPGTETFTVLERDEAGMPSVLSIGYRVHFEGAPEPEPDPKKKPEVDHVHAFDPETMRCKICGQTTEDVYANPQIEPDLLDRHAAGSAPSGPDPSSYRSIALSMAALVEDKQRQYGDSVGKTGALLAILYPGGIQPDQYDRALLVVRMLDKLSRLATNKTDLGGESPFRDIMGYAMLAIEKGI